MIDLFNIPDPQVEADRVRELEMLEEARKRFIAFIKKQNNRC